MHYKNVLALGGALVVLAATASTAVAASTVTVRIEGKNKTLLAATPVTARTGAVKIGGHSCPAASGAGAVSRAVHGAWSGKWYSFGFEAFKILGETDNFSTTHSYWELFVDNVASQSGICDVKLHRGEQILFAAVPATGTEYPLGIKAPGTAKVGHTFNVTVVAYDAKGTAKPLAGATVSVAGHSGNTNSHGTVPLTPSHAGTFTLTATSKGYIRAETQVRVS